MMSKVADIYDVSQARYGGEEHEKVATNASETGNAKTGDGKDSAPSSFKAAQRRRSSWRHKARIEALAFGKDDIARVRKMSTVNEQTYPMHVLKVSDFMQMRPGDHLTHQELKALGKVNPYKTFLGPCCFVSHQWLSYAHADPDFEQLGALQRFITKFLTGEETEVAADFITQLAYSKVKEMQAIPRDVLLEWIEHGYIWFDYFSVPQTLLHKDEKTMAEHKAAIDSIPSYAENCKVRSRSFVSGRERSHRPHRPDIR